MGSWGSTTSVWGEGYWGGSFPDGLVELDFGGVWQDVSSLVRAMSIQRGRSHELDQDSAGTLSLTLDNENNDFSPTNQTSPYWPFIKPMVKVRVSALWDLTYRLFTGYVDAWPLQGGTKGLDNFVTITATDAFKVLALAKITSRYDVEVLADTPRAFYPDINPNSTQVTDASGNGRHARLVHEMNVVDGAPIGDGHRAIEPDDHHSSYLLAPKEAGVEEVAGTDSWAVELWFNSQAETDPARPEGEPLVPLFAQRPTWEPNNSIDLFLTGQGKPFLFIGDGSSVQVDRDHKNLIDGQWHHIVLQRARGAAYDLYVDGVLVRTGAANAAVLQRNQFTIGADPFYGGFRRYASATAISKIATYDVLLWSNRIEAHYEAGVALWKDQLPGERATSVLDAAGWGLERNLDDGITVLDRFTAYDTSPLNHLQDVARSEEGRFFVGGNGDVIFHARHRYLTQTSKGIFGDQAGELPYTELGLSYGEDAIRNTVVVTGEGVEATATDDTSVALYFERAMSRASLASNPNERQAQAEWLVERYGHPDTRVDSMTLRGEAEPATLWPVIFDLELGDLVTVRRRPKGGAELIEQVSVVESISHSALVPGRRWVTTLGLSPAHDVPLGLWGNFTWAADGSEVAVWGY